ncbi:MAG: hypothetical protein AB7E51_15005 [Pseudodesulfovibrio sp.]|uniref:hypothetical protein n=1 Tax=Pseudodesulfovibrio sp. TaxID=2035812 RepID=UPI003D0D0755
MATSLMQKLIDRGLTVRASDMMYGHFVIDDMAERHDNHIHLSGGGHEAEEVAVVRFFNSTTKLLTALDTLLTETVDMDLKHGISLSEGEAFAREQALAAIAEAMGEDR